MEKKEFKDLLNTYLVPMFSGAALKETHPCRSSSKLVAYENVCILKIKPSPKANYHIRLKRSQKFFGEEIKRISQKFSPMALIQSIYVDRIARSLILKD